MSDQGWQDFVAAPGLDDWAVLHGGPTAVYLTASVQAAAELGELIARHDEAESAGITLAIVGERLTVRLTRVMWFTESRHVELARAISSIARAFGAVADRRALQEVQLAIAAQPDTMSVDFWRVVLGYAPASDDNAVDPLGRGSTVWMQDLDPARPLRHAMHLDVSLPVDRAADRVRAALAAGGRIVLDEAPAAWILADRAGNRVCIAAWPDGATPLTGGADGRASSPEQPTHGIGD